MQQRVLSGVLAICGAVVVGIGGRLPYAEVDGFQYRVFDTHTPHAILWFGVEPAAVIIAAAVIGILMLVGVAPRFTGWILATTGTQTILYFMGFIGYYAQVSDFGGHVRAGGWVGMAGAALIAAAGGVTILAREGGADASQPAGWYQDPAAPGALRYWSGTAWTEHTHEPTATGRGA